MGPQTDARTDALEDLAPTAAGETAGPELIGSGPADPARSGLAPSDLAPVDPGPAGLAPAAPAPADLVPPAPAHAPARTAADAPERNPARTPARAPEAARVHPRTSRPAHPARDAATAARQAAGGAHGTADPVKALMHRHRELCERAVDPLEIAAGLEAHGVTDRAAARYRHRDVFSLAEELFARIPAVAGESVAAGPAPARDIETRAAWSLRALLPGAACLATFVALRLTDGVLGGDARLAIGAGGTLLALIGLALALRTGPLSARAGSSGTAALCACWLLGYVLYGDDLLHQVLSGGPEGPWTLTPALLLGLALAVAPAAWCAHLFSLYAHRRLHGSHALEEFAAGVRPLLFGAVALFACVLAVLLYLARLGLGTGGSPAAAAALGVLLLLARLLTVHGFPEAAATGLAAACAVEAAAPALILAGRLPGLDPLARPVDALIEAAGTGAVPALACGAAALGLLTTATLALSRASAHTAA